MTGRASAAGPSLSFRTATCRFRPQPWHWVADFGPGLDDGGVELAGGLRASASQAAELARILKALADPVRLRLVSMVAAHDGREACVCELTEPLGPTQPSISHHLKVLVDAGDPHP